MLCAVCWATGMASCLKKYCQNNCQNFTFGDWPNVELLFKSRPVKQKLSVNVYTCVWHRVCFGVFGVYRNAADNIFCFCDVPLCDILLYYILCVLVLAYNLFYFQDSCGAYCAAHVSTSIRLLQELIIYISECLYKKTNFIAYLANLHHFFLFIIIPPLWLLTLNHKSRYYSGPKIAREFPKNEVHSDKVDYCNSLCCHFSCSYVTEFSNYHNCKHE